MKYGYIGGGEEEEDEEEAQIACMPENLLSPLARASKSLPQNEINPPFCHNAP